MTRTHPSHTAAADPDKPAFILAETGEMLSYRDMVRRSNQAAHLFSAYGLKAGDTVAYLLDNQMEFPELCWAGKNSGLYYACISVQLNSADLAYIIENSQAKLIVMGARFHEAIALVTERFAGRIKALVIGEEVPEALSYTRQRDRQPDTPLEGSGRGASMLYSSGTTGRPKAVRPILEALSPADPPRRHKVFIDKFLFSEDMVFVNPGPLYHAAPLRMMMSSHRIGGTTIAFQRYDTERALKTIERYRGTHGFFVPTMFVRMLRYREENAQVPEISSMRCAVHGAAPCAPVIKEAMMAWWGPVIYELYGGTEGVGQTTMSPEEWMTHKGSVGRPPSGCEVRVLDRDGRILGPNQTGQIYMSNGNKFSYFQDEERTREVHTADGFVTLGDVGHVDEDGYLYLTDRATHMIISGGVNIYPQEAENVLTAHPAIADVAVIGVPNDEFGEEVKAIVVPKRWPEDAAALEADIVAFCRARLSTIKCPRSVDFVTDLPRSDAGKLLKRQIRQQYWAGRSSLIS